MNLALLVVVLKAAEIKCPVSDAKRLMLKYLKITHHLH